LYLTKKFTIENWSLIGKIACRNWGVSAGCRWSNEGLPGKFHIPDSPIIRFWFYPECQRIDPPDLWPVLGAVRIWISEEFQQSDISLNLYQTVTISGVYLLHWNLISFYYYYLFIINILFIYLFKHTYLLFHYYI
jgi:hypothetical protein